MSSQAPHQSPLEQAKLEANELYSKVRRDLDSLRTAPINEFGNRIDRLQEAVKLSEDYVIRNIGQALEFSDSRIHDLEINLGARQLQLIDTQRDLRVARAQAASATAKGQDAIAKYQEAKSDFDTAELELKTLRSKMEDADEEVFRLGQQCAETREKLDAAEKHKVDLQTDLKAIKEQALAAENEAKDFQSRLMKINDITAIVSSLKMQPHAAQSASSPSPSPIRQSSVDESIDGSQPQDHHTRSESLDSHMSNGMSDPEFDLLLCQIVLDEVMDKKHRHYNQHFLKRLDPADPNVPSPINVKTCPVDLDTMTGKLATGAYTSFKSFRADFDLMIANYKRLEPPNSPLCIAAEVLGTIFEQTWSAQRISSRQSPNNASSTQGASSKKRKADTESLVPTEDGHNGKRQSLVPLDQDINHVQPVNPNSGKSLSNASYSPAQPKDTSNDSGKDETYAMKGLLTTGTRFGSEANLEVVSRPVSVIKSPNTLSSSWESLIPNEYRLTAHAVPLTVEKRLADAAADLRNDVVMISLKPASDADKSEFDRIFKYLLDKERYATVSHAGINNAEDIYLIPASKRAPYPKCLSNLNTNLLPPAKTEDVLCVVVIFRLTEDMHGQVRQAWDGLIKAIHNHDSEGLVAMKRHLLHHELPILGLRTFRLSRAAYHMPTMSSMPRSKDINPLQGVDPNVFHISDLEPDRPARLRVDGIEIPERVFLLGRVVIGSMRHGLLVVDIQHRDRPLWLACGTTSKAQYGMIKRFWLLTSKFPSSLLEWENTLSTQLLETKRQKSLKGAGLRMECCSHPQ